MVGCGGKVKCKVVMLLREEGLVYELVSMEGGWNTFRSVKYFGFTLGKSVNDGRGLLLKFRGGNLRVLSGPV